MPGFVPIWCQEGRQEGRNMNRQLARLLAGLDVNLAKQNAVSGLPAHPDISMVPFECFDCYFIALQLL